MYACMRLWLCLCIRLCLWLRLRGFGGGGVVVVWHADGALTVLSSLAAEAGGGVCVLFAPASRSLVGWEVDRNGGGFAAAAPGRRLKEYFFFFTYSLLMWPQLEGYDEGDLRNKWCKKFGVVGPVNQGASNRSD